MEETKDPIENEEAEALDVGEEEEVVPPAVGEDEEETTAIDEDDDIPVSEVEAPDA